VNRRRRAAAACLGALALVSLSACSSRPGNRRVVSDVIESLQLPQQQEDCMLEKLDTYTDDQLDQIADDNENWDPAEGSTMEDASEGMLQFIADFEQCTTEGAAAAPGSTEAAPGSTDVATASTDVATAATDGPVTTEITATTDG
jgi:hypothetical protein